MDFTLDYPAMFLVTYADNRELRNKWLSLLPKAFKTTNLTIRKMYLKLLNCDLIGQVLGYATHAHFVLEERMAENPESKKHSLPTNAKAKPAAMKEFARLSLKTRRN
jgi:peptidyl-dipeptidase Dcp